MNNEDGIAIPHTLKYGRSYWLGTHICPRCGEKGRKKVVTTKRSNPQPYLYFDHYEYKPVDVYSRYIRNCYIGKVVNGHAICITNGIVVEVVL